MKLDTNNIYLIIMYKSIYNMIIFAYWVEPYPFMECRLTPVSCRKIPVSSNCACRSDHGVDPF